MMLEDILEQAFIVKADDTVSHVASRMAEAKKYEAFVFDEKLEGVVSLDDIVKRNVSEPQKMKISYFMKPVSMFSVDTPVEDIINYMLVSEFRSLPVEKEGKLFTVSKPKMLEFVKDEVFEGKKAIDVMQTPKCVNANDSITTVLSVMKDTGNNRIPVIEGEDHFVGIVDSLGLAGMLSDRVRERYGDVIGEKMARSDVGVGKFLTKDVLSVAPDADLKKIVKKISRDGIYTVVVEEDGKFMGIITLKDILKLIGKSLETVYIRLSGLKDEDEFVKKKIDDMIENTIQKLLKFIKVNYVVIHVEEHKKKEKSDRMKYNVQGRFITDKGNFYASDYEWEPTKAMKLFLERIETEIHRQVEKNRGY
jgi:CBS domain-containing protein